MSVPFARTQERKVAVITGAFVSTVQVVPRQV